MKWLLHEQVLKRFSKSSRFNENLCNIIASFQSSSHASWIKNIIGPCLVNVCKVTVLALVIACTFDFSVKMIQCQQISFWYCSRRRQTLVANMCWHSPLIVALFYQLGTGRYTQKAKACLRCLPIA